MAEQSHKREMSDAVRGDFERLRTRRAGVGRADVTVAVPLDPAPRPLESNDVPEPPRAARSWLRLGRRRGPS